MQKPRKVGAGWLTRPLGIAVSGVRRWLTIAEPKKPSSIAISGNRAAERSDILRIGSCAAERTVATVRSSAASRVSASDHAAGSVTATGPSAKYCARAPVSGGDWLSPPA